MHGLDTATDINEEQTYVESRLELIALYVEEAITTIFTPGATVYCAADGDCSLRNKTAVAIGALLASPTLTCTKFLQIVELLMPVSQPYLILLDIVL
jgi:hypothetical protein